MRIIINCSGGSSHSMMLLEHTTVQHVKEFVADREGTPVGNQALLFAGRHLGPDSALLLEELQLDSYSLAHEVVVYMQPQLSQPIRVYLCAQPGTPKLTLFPEVVEASSTLANIQGLLQQRQLTCGPFPPKRPLQETGNGSASTSAQQQQHAGSRQGSAGGAPVGSAQGQGSSTSSTAANNSSVQGGVVVVGSSNVVVKRQDGSCCRKVHVDEDCSIEELLEAIWEVEGKSATTLTFYQARDGCLHATYGATANDG